ncbi:MAG: GntR family transcriptional regulator [Candidatus Competibacteraceae bacterium]|nr:GntR family transcriptional regulator [Candidatus Competibacteraceae bacterium]
MSHSAPAGKRRKSLSERAYTELKRRIFENELTIGAQYMEHEVAELLNMSRTPVREAFNQLAREGLVEVRPRHGMQVKPISLEDMREIYQVLTALESTAAALAAEKKLSVEETESLRKAVTDMDAALEHDDMDAWAKADVRFHCLLVELSGNKRLIEVVTTFINQSHRFRLLTLRLRPKPFDSNRDHHVVLEAIMQGDAETARKAHRQHREKSGRMLVSLVEQHGLSRI